MPQIHNLLISLCELHTSRASCTPVGDVAPLARHRHKAEVVAMAKKAMAMAACRRALLALRLASSRTLRRPYPLRSLAPLQHSNHIPPAWFFQSFQQRIWLHAAAVSCAEVDDGEQGTGKVEPKKQQQPSKVENQETREFVQQVHLASLKKKLRDDSRDCISYQELLQMCRTAGMASDDQEAAQLARAFNQAGVVLTFRDRVHIHPEKIAELVANVLPLALLGEDDKRRLELLEMGKQKEAIDMKAHRQMRVILWSGLVVLTLHVLVFFRLTFWEFSWDVMEPIAFFATAGGLISGYTYFLFTSRDPTYQDFMQRLFLSRQGKLFKKQNFDIKKFKELQMQCQSGWKPLTKNVMDDDSD